MISILISHYQKLLKQRLLTINFISIHQKYNTLGYDMIIGRYLMKKLGMISNFNNKILIWYDVIIPM